MAKELIVSVNGREKKIAIVENEKVTEFYIERGEGNQGIVGNIYKGRVMRVLPGMQSAFVNIGLERDAFLYVSDFFDEEEEFERIVIDKSQKGNVEEAQRAAAEEIALARVERERHIAAGRDRQRAAGERVGIPLPDDRGGHGADVRRAVEHISLHTHHVVRRHWLQKLLATPGYARAVRGFALRVFSRGQCGQRPVGPS